MGAGPRRSGSSEGCTFKPPYCARLRRRGGTRSPKETAIIISKGVGGFHPVKVSISCVARESSFLATSLMGTADGQLLFPIPPPVQLPSLMSFKPLPVGFPGRWTTSIDSTSFSSVSACLASSRARSDAMLNSSDPQNNILRGRTVSRELKWRRFGVSKDRTEEDNLQIIVCGASVMDAVTAVNTAGLLALLTMHWQWTGFTIPIS